MQNLKSFGQLEIYETKLENFSNLTELSKCQKSVIFFEIHKNKKSVPGEWAEEGVCKI